MIRPHRLHSTSSYSAQGPTARGGEASSQRPSVEDISALLSGTSSEDKKMTSCRSRPERCERHKVGAFHLAPTHHSPLVVSSLATSATASPTSSRRSGASSHHGHSIHPSPTTDPGVSVNSLDFDTRADHGIPWRCSVCFHDFLRLGAPTVDDARLTMRQASTIVVSFCCCHTLPY